MNNEGIYFFKWSSANARCLTRVTRFYACYVQVRDSPILAIDYNDKTGLYQQLSGVVIQSSVWFFLAQILRRIHRDCHFIPMVLFTVNNAEAITMSY